MDLKQRAKDIINSEKKEMTPLIYEENKFINSTKIDNICKKGFSIDDDDDDDNNKK